MSCDRTVFERGIHGAPAEALRQALEALAGLSFWIAWTADPDLQPETPVSARCIRDAATALHKAARILDAAADQTDPPARSRRADNHPPRTHPADPTGALGHRLADVTPSPRLNRPAEAETSPGGAGANGPERPRAAPVPSSTETSMNHIASPPEPLIREIPLCRLALAPENVRKTPPDGFAEEPAPGLHQGARPAGEPRRLRRRRGRERRRALRRRRRRTPPRGAEGARRGRHARCRLPGALQDRRERQRGRALARGERHPHRHAPGRPSGRVLHARRRRRHRRRHRRAFRRQRAHRRAAAAARQRRA